MGDSGAILKTTDAGTTWAHKVSGTSNTLNSVSFCNGQQGYAAGEHVVCHTLDGGENWAVAPDSLTFTAIETLCDSVAEIAYLGGKNGYVRYSTNAGTTWNERIFPGGKVVAIGIQRMASALYSITIATQAYTFHSLSTDSIWESVGNAPETTYATLGGYLRDTIQFLVGVVSFPIGGEISPYFQLRGSPDSSWELRLLPADGFEPFTIQRAPRSSTFYMAGSHEEIYKSAGSDTSLVQQTRNYSPVPILYSLSFSDEKNGFAVGMEGVILHTSNGGVSSVTEGYRLPRVTQLFQNYPNPLNPTTSIDYALPERLPVRLTVYNVLGEEINTLLNEIQPGGYHSVTLDAGELPSGVYFYRLQAGNFTAAKKMILVK